jgi:glyoxylase-like metal-dependent hydrolase (beta-lactamase superfamily II)/predicted phosphodiesterase
VTWVWGLGLLGLPSLGRGLSADEEVSFRFVVLADPQFGMTSGNRDTLEETRLLGQAVEELNELRPAFVAVVGDLVSRPGDDGQRSDLMRTAAKLDDTIPLHWVAGNHDVENQPTPESLSWYRRHFGRDRYEFHHGGWRFVVLNSTLIKEPAQTAEENAAQWRWLEETLRSQDGDVVPPTIVFLHHPLFLKSADETDQYFNLPQPARERALRLFRSAGVVAAFAGHYHRQSRGDSDGFEMITSGPVGKPLGDDPSGYTVVDVYDTRIESRYVPLGPPVHDGGPSEEARMSSGTACRVTPLLVGTCSLGADHVLGDEHREEDRIPFALLSFLVEGSRGETAVVDLGPMTLDYTNAMFRRYGFFRDLGAESAEGERYPDDIRQPHGNVLSQLEERSVPPESVQHVVLTHLHADHHGIDDATDGGAAERFTRARFHVSRAGWEDNLARRQDGRWASYVDFAFGDFLQKLQRQGRLRLAETASEVFPGLRTLYLGGHSVCSQAVLVTTSEGLAIITSDDIYRYDLLARNVLPRIHTSVDRYREAVERLVRLAELEDGVLVPVHDPAVWDAYHGDSREWLRELRRLSRKAIRAYRTSVADPGARGAELPPHERSRR